MIGSYGASQIAQLHRQALLEEAARERLVREALRGTPSIRARAAALLRSAAARLDEQQPAVAEMSGGSA